MANSIFQNRFTNELYATKRDVQNALKTTMVDRYWNDIVEYRSNFLSNLGIKSFEDMNFSICLAPTICEKINAVEKRLNNFFKKYISIDSKGVKKSIKNRLIADNIKTLANVLSIDISEEELNLIIEQNASAIAPEKLILVKYVAVLNDLYTKESISSFDTVNSYLFEIAQDISGLNPDGGIYREKALSANKLEFNNIYEESPIRLIEPLMNNLFSFLKTSNKSPLIKIVTAIFMINYIKPFEFYNELISSVFAKFLLLNSDFEQIAVFIDFNAILVKTQRLFEMMNECKKTWDLTYFLNYFLDKIEPHLVKLIDVVVEEKANEIKEEYYEIKKEEAHNVEHILEKEELIATPFENKKEVFEEVSYRTNEDFLEPIHDENTQQSDDSIRFTRNAAITNLTFGYSEEEAIKVEQHLMESNPNLTQSQAYFYARHCTIGKFYTISQYKKAVGCAYETARTSMDKLVSEGYYSKEGYKNKFIYSPIKRK